LADFGLSKRIEEASKSQTKIFGVIPYVDPKSFTSRKSKDYHFNEKSDIYSVGVLLWEISSGQPPFSDMSYDVGLAIEILRGIRETPVPDTPEDYVKIYTGKYNYYIKILLLIFNFIKKNNLFRMLGWRTKQSVKYYRSS